MKYDKMSVFKDWHFFCPVSGAFEIAFEQV